MTCPCHDPVVFGHLNCDHSQCPCWETQPRARQATVAAPWTTIYIQRATQTAQALTEALRSAGYRFQPGGLVQNPAQPPRTGENP